MAETRRSKPVTVTLGDLQRSIDRRLKSGSYSSASEVVRAGLRALDREEAALDEIVRRKVMEALDDPRPDVELDDAFSRLRSRHARRLADGMNDV